MRAIVTPIVVLVHKYSHDGRDMTFYTIHLLCSCLQGLRLAANCLRVLCQGFTIGPKIRITVYIHTFN